MPRGHLRSKPPRRHFYIDRSILAAPRSNRISQHQLLGSAQAEFALENIAGKLSRPEIISDSGSVDQSFVRFHTPNSSSRRCVKLPICFSASSRRDSLLRRTLNTSRAISIAARIARSRAERRPVAAAASLMVWSRYEAAAVMWSELSPDEVPGLSEVDASAWPAILLLAAENSN